MAEVITIHLTLRVPYSLLSLCFPVLPNESFHHSLCFPVLYLSVCLWGPGSEKVHSGDPVTLSLSLRLTHRWHYPPVARGLSHRSILACTDWYHATGMPPSWSPHFPQWRLVDTSWYCINLLGQTPSRQDISNSFDQPMLLNGEVSVN